MLINRKRKFVIFMPFKNYSNSLLEFFSKWSCYTRYVGDSPHYSWEPPLFTNAHTCSCPDLIMSNQWTRFLPLRNPYDRVISQWKWHMQMEKTETSFDDWLMTQSKQAVCMPVTKVYPHHTDILKCENIIEELMNNELFYFGPNRKKQIQSFPHANKSKMKKSFVELTQRQQEIIYYYHYEDFITGEYSKTYNPS